MDEELTEMSSFFNFNCLLIGYTMLYLTELKSQDTTQLEENGIMGQRHLRRWGKILDIPCPALKYFL